MERDYPKRLSALAEGLPADARVIGLVGVGDRAESAALAADLAAAVASRRGGHTILVSFEEGEAALDHEVGQEGGPGLSDVFRGREKLADVAASGRVRGFIYLPAGADPIRPDRLVASRAWAKLASSAVERGATLLLFLPAGIPVSAIAGRLDGVVRVGEARPGDERGEGSIDASVPVLGRLAPPGAGPGVEPPEDPAWTEPAAPVLRRDPRRGRRRPARPAAAGGPEDRAMRERRSGDRAAGGRRRGSRLAGALLLVAGGALAAAAFAVFGSGDREPFLPQNDSLWSSPVAPREEDAGPDSPAGRDTDDADAAEAGAGGRP